MIDIVTPIDDLLTTITSALTSTNQALAAEDRATITSIHSDGISLLDSKNDLLLSYLQHIVFLILLRLRHSQNTTDYEHLARKVASRLIELRAYLDRGVRPLETKLRYQIDKLLRASDDADRTDRNKPGATISLGTPGKKVSKRGRRLGSDISASESESDGSKDTESEEERIAAESDEEILTRPNTSALTAAVAKTQAQNRSLSSSRQPTSDRAGVYKPPRINATAMPEYNTTVDREERRVARTRKNALLDEYIDEEHSSAPAVQSSIGANNTILDKGRTHTSLHSKDRSKEKERRNYEETNFVRLPATSKAERRKEKARERALGGRDMFGGEDWTGLGGLGERIGRDVDGGRAMSKLERREKRKRDTTDLPRGDGTGTSGRDGGGEIGQSFEKRRRVLQARTEKKANRRR